MNWFSNFWNNLTQPVTWNSNNTNSGNSSSLYSPVAQSTQNMSYGTPNVSTYGGTQAQANQTSSLLTDKINQFKPVQTMSYGQNMSYGKPTFTSTTSGSLNNTLNTSTNNTDYGSGYNSLYTPQTYSQTDYQQGNNTQTSTQNNQNQVNTQSNTNTGADLLNSLKPVQQFTVNKEGQDYLNKIDFASNELQKFYSNNEPYSNELAQINAQFQNIKNQQTQENSYREEAARQQGITSGLAFSTPSIYSSEISNIIDTGISKLSDITSKQNQLVLQAKNQSIADKKNTLIQLQNLSKEKYDAVLKMKDDFYNTQKIQDEQINKQVSETLPAIYDYVNKLPEDQKVSYLTQVSSTLGVPVTKFMSAYRNFDMQENNNIRDMYKTIANNVAKENPQLALEIMQKSMTPQGRQELLSSPYFKTMSSVANFGNAIGGLTPSKISDVGFDAVRNAIFSQESGGNYNAVNKDSGALGKYQIMPKYWFSAVGLNPNSEQDKQKFLQSPQLQDTLFNYILNTNSQKYSGDLQKVIAAYYGGDLAARNIGTAQGDIQGAIGANGKPTGYPSVNQYVAQVMNRLNKSSSINNNQQIQTQDYSTLANSVASILYKSDNKKRNAFIENVLSSPTPTEAVYGAINEELVNRKSNVLLSDVDTNLDQLQSLNDLMTQYYARGGETSWLKGKRSKIENRFGTTSDAELAALGTSILDTIMQYRKVTTGAAFSEKEKIDIDSIFPGIGKDKNLNDAIIQRRITDVNNKKTSLISQVIGKNLANQFYNSNQQVNSNLTDEQLLQMLTQ